MTMLVPAAIAAFLTLAAGDLDLVTLQGGASLRGTVVEETRAGVTVQLPDGTTRKFGPGEVSSITYGDGKVSTLTAPAATEAAPVAAAPAQPIYVPPMPRRDPTYHRHLGFFIRPELGFGGLSTSASQDGTKISMNGAGGAFAIAIGGAVAEDLIVAFQAWDMLASDPTVKVSSGGGSSSGTGSGNVGVVGYGVLLNWYLQPSNVYLAITPSLTRLATTNESGTSTSATDWGLGARLAFGKEWWVSDHWGLGVAAALGLSSNRDSGAGTPTWGTTAYSVTFSATYN